MTSNVSQDMALQSLLFLQQNNIPINCSVYSLTSGHLHFQDIATKIWHNDSVSFLPAFYITNCSIPRLLDLVSNQDYADLSATDIKSFPYNDRDNGDTFVALLFTISGSCVSCWMLTLLLYLSPKHKRKPLIAQFATIFYSVVTTIILSQITRGCEDEYYRDTLDIVRLHQIVYNDNIYRITIVLSQLSIQIAWFQIVLKISKQRIKGITSIIGGVLILAHTAISICFQVKYNNTESILDSTSSGYNHFRIARVSIKLLIILWLAGSLLYFTTVMKNPRKICYSRRLFPLGLFNWFLIVLHITLNILTVTLYKHNWLINTWLFLLPYLVEIILLTTVWEWVFNIRYLEKRFELMGVLGRRISLEDVISLHSQDGSNKVKRVDLVTNLMSRFFRRHHAIVAKDDSDTSIELKDVSTTSNDSSKGTPAERRTTQHTEEHEEASEGTRLTTTEESSQPRVPPIQDVIRNSTNNTPNRDPNRSGSALNNEHPSNRFSSAGSFDDEYVDNYDIWNDNEDDDDDTELQYNNYHHRQQHHQQQQQQQQQHPLQRNSSGQPQVGSSSGAEEHPPPFEVHPGFNAGDYWNDRKE
ncbi:uncharacterized protein RJT20DRAFT_7293 [Scheffersomyces xylosifermentans]|uniref:uncharacterized protein n=1 Tax=Scheffersomyces xylosifermentans TaxID=1304137 RepID=UPI00315D8374